MRPVRMQRPTRQEGDPSQAARQLCDGGGGVRITLNTEPVLDAYVLGLNTTDRRSDGSLQAKAKLASAG